MSTADAFGMGFVIGNLLYLLVLGLIFWFVGRWGWVGLVIRIICGGLILWRLILLLSLVRP